MTGPSSPHKKHGLLKLKVGGGGLFPYVTVLKLAEKALSRKNKKKISVDQLRMLSCIFLDIGSCAVLVNVVDRRKWGFDYFCI